MAFWFISDSPKGVNSGFMLLFKLVFIRCPYCSFHRNELRSKQTLRTQKPGVQP